MTASAGEHEKEEEEEEEEEDAFFPRFFEACEHWRDVDEDGDVQEEEDGDGEEQ